MDPVQLRKALTALGSEERAEGGQAYLKSARLEEADHAVGIHLANISQHPTDRFRTKNSFSSNIESA